MQQLHRRTQPEATDEDESRVGNREPFEAAPVRHQADGVAAEDRRCDRREHEQRPSDERDPAQRHTSQHDEHRLCEDDRRVQVVGEEPDRADQRVPRPSARAAVAERTHEEPRRGDAAQRDQRVHAALARVPHVQRRDGEDQRRQHRDPPAGDRAAEPEHRPHRRDAGDGRDPASVQVGGSQTIQCLQDQPEEWRVRVLGRQQHGHRPACRLDTVDLVGPQALLVQPRQSERRGEQQHRDAGADQGGARHGRSVADGRTAATGRPVIVQP